MYKLLPDCVATKTPSKNIQRLSDNSFIPMNEENSDYQAYLKWLEAGNTPEAADAATLPADTGA